MTDGTIRPATGTQPETGKLGTFAGVFTPSVLTILGIILFLRLGYVVGNAGLGRALVVIALANVVSVLTSCSLAAIATNFRVKGGGDYYLISRTLGHEFGGAIGITLFLAQSISIAFYAIGFAEGVAPFIEVAWLTPRWIAALALGPLFVLAWIGSDWATRFQYVIMAALVLALAVFTIGAAQSFEFATLRANWSPAGELPFWVLFALFFPAVTGFTQGVSMSGDLQDPARSLPLGTFLAVGLSMVVYLAAATLFAGAAPGAELIADYDAMRRVALWPLVITIGICSATLSSSLASFLGAPRILQALASDRLFPFLTPFATVTKTNGNPRRAVLLASGIAFATIMVGDLNVVAPVVSMFFLVSYGLLNYATYVEARAESPSFRPRFHWYSKNLSLLGCLVCGALMLAIDPTAGGVAIGVLAAIHQYLAHTVERASWADSSRSVQFQRVRRSLHSMNATEQHDRDWRPVILAFTENPERRERLLHVASWIEGGSGMTTAVQIITGVGRAQRAERDAKEAEIAADLKERGLDAFARVVVTSDPESGFEMVLQASGLGPIQPNIALFHWFDREGVALDAPAMRAYTDYLRLALRLGVSVAILAAYHPSIEAVLRSQAKDRRVDVWWQADASSRLALLLAYLVTRHHEFEDAELRVLVPERVSKASGGIAEVERRLEEIRIPAQVVPVEGDGWRALGEAAAGAALAFYPFRMRRGGLCDIQGAPLPTSLDGMPPMVLVNAAEDMDLDAQPDTEEQAAEAAEDKTQATPVT